MSTNAPTAARAVLWTLSSFLVLIFSGLALPAYAAPDAAPLAPTNISCQGYERTTVKLYWTDNATDETEYRVERSIGGAAFTEVATLGANATSWQDTGVDPAVQDHRYRVRAFRSGGADNFSAYSPICNNRRVFETAHFRIFFGLRGTSDDCPQINGNDVCLANDNVAGTNKYVKLTGDALEGSVAAFQRLGFTRDAGVHGTLDKIPINVVWCDGGGCAGGGGLGLSPFLMEKAFNLTTRVGDPIAWLVSEHEAFHFQQFKYGGIGGEPDGRWVYEGQARMSQDKVCIGADRTTCQAFDDVTGGYAGYVGESNYYLATMSNPLPLSEYRAALFWAYLTERYGTSVPTDAVENGMNLLVQFWNASDSAPGRDGITVINQALAALGTPARFRDAWKDFVVTAYTKNLAGGVPAQYKLKDAADPGGTAYNLPALDLDQPLGLNNSILRTDQTIYPWAARYYRITPAANVPVIPIKVVQDSANPVFYAILGIQGSNLTYIDTFEGRNLDRTLVNSGFSKVVVVVAGLDSLANYRISFNATAPSLRIRMPTSTERARVGSPSAPDKFMAAVEVLAGDGTPLSGINLSQFSFKVGTQPVIASNIVASSTVQGQQWFVIRAPGQAAAGLYDLTARYSTILTGTQTQAVDYSPRNNADSMLVVDRSGSMAASGKMDAAKNAARLFIDSWKTGDKIGLLSFNATPSNPVDLTLRDWTDNPAGGSRKQAFDAINALVALGGTNIGDSIMGAWDQLKASGDPAHDWGIVLVSDGNEQDSTPTTTFPNAIAAIVNAPAGTKKPVIHAVAIGPDADAPRMQSAAQQTGGTYQFVSVPAPMGTAAADAAAAAALQLDIDGKYRYIATKMVGGQQIFSYVGPQTPADNFEESVAIPVEQGGSELVVSLSWVGFMANYQLVDPSNNLVTPFEFDTQHVLWRVPAPAGGTWTLTAISFQGPNAAAATAPTANMPPFYVQASLKSDLTMDSFLGTPVDQRTPGTPMLIESMLTDNAPVPGANVVASILRPDGFGYNMQLYDDGSHGDGAAADGLYANTFYLTGLIGNYNVTITAEGLSAFAGAFTRQDVLAFYLFSTTDNPDADGDGLPDDWERTYYGDPLTYNGQDDPDHDGLPNVDEWTRGTNPMDPDTDDGGEADSTDPNPLDPSDDRVQPLRLLAVPGISQVYLRYTPGPDDQAIRVYRGSSEQGPFEYLNDFVPMAGTLVDTQVTNNQQYCYIAQRVNTAAALSASSSPTCATPKADPLPPHGAVVINGGVSKVNSVNVQLTLIAGDDNSPEGLPPDAFMPDVPSDTATGVQQMRISNSPDSAGAAWEPYTRTKSWQLAPNGDLATVYVQYMDGAGNVSDTALATVQIEGAVMTDFVYLPLIDKQ